MQAACKMMTALVHSVYFLVMKVLRTEIKKKIQLLPSVLHGTSFIDFFPELLPSCIAPQIRADPTRAVDSLPSGMVHCSCTVFLKDLLMMTSTKLRLTTITAMKIPAIVTVSPALQMCLFPVHSVKKVKRLAQLAVNSHTAATGNPPTSTWTSMLCPVCGRLCGP